MTEIYREDQVKEIFPYWPAQVDYFLLGGPGLGNEAQTVREKYPDVKCIGFEPNKEMVTEQRRRGFPGHVWPVALSAADCRMPMVIPKNNPQASSIHHPQQDDFPINRFVWARKLDSMEDACSHQFTNSVLWLDIEHAEFQALKGAKRLLGEGKILLINLETYESTLPPIVEYLKRFGLEEVHRWNGQADTGRWDIIFKLEERNND